MHVILKKDIPQLGRIGDVVKVRPGYARNFLIPRQLALGASAGNAHQLEHQKKLVELHKKKVQKDSQAVADKMGDIKLTLKRRVNEAGKLFGSLGSAEISEELSAKKYTIDRRDIEIEAVKVPGSYKAKIRLAGDVFVEIAVEVVALEEKKAAAKGKKDAAGKGTKKKATKKAAAEGTEEDEESASEVQAAEDEDTEA